MARIIRNKQTPAGGIGSPDRVADPAARGLFQQIIAQIGALLNPAAAAAAGTLPVRITEAITRIAIEGGRLKAWTRRSIFAAGELAKTESEVLRFNEELPTATSSGGGGGTTTIDEGDLTQPGHSHEGFYDGGFAGFLSGDR